MLILLTQCELIQSLPTLICFFSLNVFQKVIGELQIHEQMRRRRYTLSSFKTIHLGSLCTAVYMSEGHYQFLEG